MHQRSLSIARQRDVFIERLKVGERFYRVAPSKAVVIIVAGCPPVIAGWRSKHVHHRLSRQVARAAQGERFRIAIDILGDATVVYRKEAFPAREQLLIKLIEEAAPGRGGRKLAQLPAEQAGKCGNCNAAHHEPQCQQAWQADAPMRPIHRPVGQVRER